MRTASCTRSRTGHLDSGGVNGHFVYFNTAEALAWPNSWDHNAYFIPGSGDLHWGCGVNNSLHWDWATWRASAPYDQNSTIEVQPLPATAYP